MAAAPKRRHSDFITRRQIENMQEGAVFAFARGYPLNLIININWTRTGLGDDLEGQVADQLMVSCRKWLKPRHVPIFAQIEVRECPNGCPNTHLLVHCPVPIMPAFQEHVQWVLRRACGHLHKGAIKFGLVGRGNPTAKAALGKLLYLSKGADPDAAEHFNIDRSPQGRIHGKRISISQDINRTARQRHAECRVAKAILASNPQDEDWGCQPSMRETAAP